MAGKNLSWDSPLEELFPKNRLSKSAEKIIAAGFTHLKDLLWLLPLRIHNIPSVQSFDHIVEGMLFSGEGEVLHVESRPNTKMIGKRGITLQNLSVRVKDRRSQQVLTLKWFNAYPSMVKKVNELNEVIFLGEISQFRGALQIVNPEILKESPDDTPGGGLKVQYPTTNSVPSAQIKKIMEKIPSELWNHIPENTPSSVSSKYGFDSLSKTFSILHGIQHADKKERKEAFGRLIYEEFFQEQIKIQARKEFLGQKPGPVITVNGEQRKVFEEFFPYELTEGQSACLNQIEKDLSKGTPMMRLIQGDVGCGKTTVAIISALMAIENGYQVALMCPTETLAIQHYHTIKEVLASTEVEVALLVGGTNQKRKRELGDEMKYGHVDFVVGTHALFQDSVEFKKLGLAIIDEQHKFGVSQRQRLSAKGEGTHTLIMTATPIPRSLSLTQYGDLHVSTIKSMPSNRKGHKTRIVHPDKFSQFLNFVQTRLGMGEQVYVVVPAIEESENLDILNLNKVLDRFRGFYPGQCVEGLHGKMDAFEKNEVFNRFKSGEIKILISTSVIEVGINVLNATIIAVMNPERFGLSSLHQLRGRVGRGEKPGFCFLVCDKPLSPQAFQRLSVIEKSSDGFVIAEEDLKIRGEGDLFGTNQSGGVTSRKVANILEHSDTLFMAQEDVETLIQEKDPALSKLIQAYKDETLVFSTI